MFHRKSASNSPIIRDLWAFHRPSHSPNSCRRLLGCTLREMRLWCSWWEDMFYRQLCRKRELIKKLSLENCIFISRITGEWKKSWKLFNLEHMIHFVIESNWLRFRSSLFQIAPNGSTKCLLLPSSSLTNQPTGRRRGGVQRREREHKLTHLTHPSPTTTHLIACIVV